MSTTTPQEAEDHAKFKAYRISSLGPFATDAEVRLAKHAYEAALASERSKPPVAEPLPKVEILCMARDYGNFLKVNAVTRYENGGLQIIVSAAHDWSSSMADIAYRAALEHEPADGARRQAFMAGAKWMASLSPIATRKEPKP